MTREITISLGDILDLVSCADDYGHNDAIFCAFAEMVGHHVSDEEIQEYADGFLTEESRAQGYGEEDRDASIVAIKEWRDQYCGAKI